MTASSPRSSRSARALGFALLALASLAAAPAALAGRRHTVWAYPPGAGPKGSVEAETWVTVARADDDAPTTSEYRLEIENGLSDDVSLDVYLGVIKQDPEEGTRVDRVQAALRANILPARLRNAIDLTGYFELKRDIELSNPWEFEAILIGGKSFGRLSYGFNMVYESHLDRDLFDKDARELKAIVTGGYEIDPRVWAGAEMVVVKEGEESREWSIGPTLSLSLTPKTWISIGPQFGLNDRTDDLKVRAIFGIFF